MSPSQNHQAPDEAAQSFENPDSASKAKKTSRKERHRKTKDPKENKHDKKMKKEDKSKKTEAENSAPSSADPRPQKQTPSKSSATTQKESGATHQEQTVPTPQKQTPSKSSSTLRKESGASFQEQTVPTPQNQSESVSKKLPASTRRKQSTNVSQKQPTSTPQKRSAKTTSPTRLEVQIPSSSQPREEYVEMTLDSDDECTPSHETNPTFMSGIQLLRKEVQSPFMTKNKPLFAPGTPTTNKSQGAGKGSSQKKPKSEVIKKEPANKPSPTKKKKREPSLPPDPYDVVQLSSSVDSDSEIELQAIYDTPKRGRSSKDTSPLKQNAVTSAKSITSSGTLDDSDIEVQAIRKTPPARMRAQSQPPNAKSPTMAAPSTPTPKKNNQPAKSSARSARASTSKPDTREPAFQERAKRSRTMSPSLSVKKPGGSKQQQALKPSHKPMANGTPEKTDCIDLTSAMTSDDDEKSEKDHLLHEKFLNQNKLSKQLPAAGLHEGKKRSWDEMHSSSYKPENEHPSKKLKLENAISRIVQSSLRQKDKPVTEEESHRLCRRRHSAEAVAYFHLTGWKKLVKNKASPLATKTRGIMSLFSWTEVQKLKKLLREKAD